MKFWHQSGLVMLHTPVHASVELSMLRSRPSSEADAGERMEPPAAGDGMVYRSEDEPRSPPAAPDDVIP